MSKNKKKREQEWYDSTDKDELWGVNLDPHEELKKSNMIVIIVCVAFAMVFTWGILSMIND